MTRHRFLETFSQSPGPPSAPPEAQDLMEAARAEGYEAGYASGWDDAIASDQTSRMRMAAEFERNIQNLAFTFAEAVTHVRGELRGFLTDIVDQFFPAIAPEALRGHVAAELLRLGEERMDVPVQIVTSPDCNQMIAEMLKADFSLDVALVEDSSLSPGQVYVRLGAREMEVDLGPLIKAVSSQLKAIGTAPDPKEDE